MWSLSKYELLMEYCKLRNCYGVWVTENFSSALMGDLAYVKLEKTLWARLPAVRAETVYHTVLLGGFILMDEEKEMDVVFSAMHDPSVKEYFFTVTCGPNGGLDES